MTKYILHGGETKVDNESNKKFFFECTNLPQEKVTILCIYFAKTEKSAWAESFEFAKKKFCEAAPQKELAFILADENLEILKEQIKKADVIYIHGGTTSILKEKLDGLKDFADRIQGKVVAGSSAGACILSKYSYSNSKKIIQDGFGILPIKFFGHYSEEFEKEKCLLDQYKEKLPMYLIRETEFVILEI